MKDSITSFWTADPKPKKWTLKITPTHNGDRGDYIVTLPDDLIESAGWSLNDTLEFVDNHDGSFSVKKAN